MDNWICAKCGNNSFERSKIHTTGGKFSKLYDVQNKKFTTITCDRCGYTELYREDVSAGMNILDFLFGK